MLDQETLFTSLHAGLLMAILGVIVWTTGRSFVFPSLGPSAFVLAYRPRAQLSARNVIGGHFFGVVVGLLTYKLLADGLTVSVAQTPLSVESLLLGLSGIVSVAFTTAAMLLTRTVHAPACATTLIIALGLLPGVVDGLIIMVSVTILYLSDRAVESLRRQERPTSTT